MRCEEIMQQDVFSVSAGESVLDAAAIMRDRNIGFLPVLDEDGRAVGTLTDRDIAIRLCANDLRPSELCIADVMTTDVVSCGADEELRTCEQLMKQFQKSRVIVVDDEERVVGIISLTDIATLDTQRHAARTLRQIAVRDFRE